MAMRLIDLAVFPDQMSARAELTDALSQLDLGQAEIVEPADAASAAGIALPADLDDDAVRARAEEIRDQLDAALDGISVRFQLGDASSGGSPDHLE